MHHGKNRISNAICSGSSMINKQNNVHTHIHNFIIIASNNNANRFIMIIIIGPLCAYLAVSRRVYCFISYIFRLRFCLWHLHEVYTDRHTHTHYSIDLPLIHSLLSWLNQSLFFSRLFLSAHHYHYTYYTPHLTEFGSFVWFSNRTKLFAITL